MTRRWWSDADAARDLLGRVSSDDGVSGAGAALLGLHALGAKALSGLAGSTAVSADEVRSVLAGVDHSSAADAWKVTSGGDLDEVKAAADAGAWEIVDTLTSAGVPWPLALQRASEGYGLPPGEAAVYASRVAAPVLPPPVVADVADVALGAWAASASACAAEPVSKAEEDWVEVRVGGRRMRRRVLRDEEGQFAVQGESGQQKREARVFDGSKLSMAEYKSLSQAEKDAYVKARHEVAQAAKRRRGKREQRAEAAQQKLNASSNILRQQMEAERQRMEAARLPRSSSQVRVNTDRLKEQRKQEIKERGKKAKRQMGQAARHHLSDIAAARKLLSAEDFSAVDVDESTLLVDALAAMWPVGYPNDPGAPGNKQALDRMLDEINHTVNAQVAMLESDAKTPAHSPDRHTVAHFNDERAKKIPVLTTNIYGIQMLQRAKNRSEIPAMAFEAANIGWRNRQLEGFDTNEFDLPAKDSPGAENQLFQFRTLEPGMPLVMGDMSGQLRFNIPLSMLVGVARPGTPELVTPLIGTSLTMRSETVDWIDAAQELYLGLADIPLPAPEGSTGQVGTALDLLAGGESLKTIAEIAGVLSSPAFDDALRTMTVRIGAKTFNYPETGEESRQMLEAVTQNMKTDDANRVFSALHDYKRTIVVNALGNVCESSEEANMVIDFLDRSPRVMPSMFQIDRGWMHDNVDVIHSAIGLVQNFVNETSKSPYSIENLDWNTIGSVNYSDKRVDGFGLMTPDVGDVPQNVVKTLVMQMRQRYGDTSDSVGFTSELIDAVYGPRRRG